MQNIAGTLFFVANDGSNGYELWKSDGTSAGTLLVRDIRPGGFSSGPRWLTNVSGTLFFAANDGSGHELWKSDGTSAGTRLVRDINPGTGPSNPSHLANVNGILFFQATDGIYGVELWRSDGTSNGTAMVQNIRLAGGDSSPKYLTNVGGRLFFQANDGTHGAELWIHREGAGIIQVTPPSPGTYKPGQALDFLVQFDNTVTVTTTGGTPRLVLDIGGTTRYANYVSGSGSDTLLFRYVVQAGDFDDNGIALLSPVDANGGAIRDPGGRSADLNFSSPDTSGVLVDGLVPFITGFGLPANGTYHGGDTLQFALQWNENVAVSGGTPRLRLSLTNGDRYANYVSGSGTSTLVFQYTVQVGDYDFDGISLQSPLELNGATITSVADNDPASLGFTPPDTSGILVDAFPGPIITSVTPPAAGTYVTGMNLTFVVRFSRVVNVNTSGGTPRLRLIIGGATRYATYQSGSGTNQLVFSYTVDASDADMDGIEVVPPLDFNGGTIQDSNNNDADPNFTPPDTSGVRIPPPAPSVTTITVPNPGTYRTYQPLNFVLRFSDTVIVNTAGGTPRLALNVGGSTRYAPYLSGSNTDTLVFRYIVQPGDWEPVGIGINPVIQLNGGSIRDTSGKPALLGFSPPSTSGILVDGMAPHIVSVTPPGAGSYRSGDALNFAVRFSEPVFVGHGGSLPSLSLIIGSTTRQASYVGGSSTDTLTFRYIVQPTDLDTNGITILSPIQLNGATIRDAAQNEAVLSFDPPDTSGVLVGIPPVSAPTIVQVQPPAPGTYRAGQTLSFVVQFSEAVSVTGVPRLVLTVGSNTAYGTYNSGSGSPHLTFVYTVPAHQTDTNGITVHSPVDLNGGTIQNGSGTPAVLSFDPPDTSGVLVDSEAPGITGVTAPANGTYRAGQALVIRVQFSEPVVVGISGSARPYLRLRIGTAVRNAVLSGSPAANVLLFRYVVQSGDSDTNGIEILSPILRPSGTYIRDQAGNDANTSFTPPNTSGVRVDAVAPRIVQVVPPAAGTYFTGQRLEFLVRFSEPVTVTTAGSTRPALRLRIGSSLRQAEYVGQVNATTLRFRYVVQASDFDSNGIEILSPMLLPAGTSIRDAAGNSALTAFVPPSTANILVNVPARPFLPFI
jgi:ELWxxDGT repeat protein